MIPNRQVAKGRTLGCKEFSANEMPVTSFYETQCQCSRPAAILSPQYVNPQVEIVTLFKINQDTHAHTTHTRTHLTSLTYLIRATSRG